MTGTDLAGDSDADLACLVALAGLEQVGPSRLAGLLEGRTAQDAWAAVCRGWVRQPGVTAALGAAWAAAARATEPAALLDAHRAAGVAVLRPDDPRLGGAFDDDPLPPPVLFALGDPGVVRGAAAAVVGTRDCTSYGEGVAEELGRELAAAGVAVVSGLALGIDGRAHRGALAAAGAPPIGVVGSGLDRPYPPRHRRLWDEVADAGLLLSEHPLGTGVRAWHFPARNRLIAGLADVVVVVESHERGGSLSTVTEALARGKDVLAVPGSVRSPASAGTNRLLYDGCGMARGADDVLFRLGQVPGVRASRPVPAGPGAGRRAAPADPDAVAVLDAVGWEPASLEQVVHRTGQPIPTVARLLAALEAGGWVVATGGWYQRATLGGGR